MATPIKRIAVVISCGSRTRERSQWVAMAGARAQMATARTEEMKT